MKKWLSLILALAMVFSLVACGGDSAGDDTQSDDPDVTDDGTTSSDPDTLKVVELYDPGTFQPGNNDEQGFNRLMRQIYEPLFYLDAEGNVEPWLAESYEWEDPTHFLVHLREGVKFSDGSDFTAEDVIWTITYAIETALPNSQYTIVDPAECEVRDDLTCVIGLKTPQVTFASHLASPMCGIASKAAFEASDGDYLGGAVVGTGPYKLDSYTQGDIIQMSANEYYWREGEPKIPNLEIRIILDDTTRATEAKALGADIIIEPNVREQAAIEETDGMHMETTLCANTTYLLMNTAKAPMDNVKVREAFARAIDTKGTVSLVYGDFGSAATGFICPDILGYNEETYQKYYGAGHDLETAKTLLAEAGYPDGIDLEISVEANNSQRCDMAEAMQAQVQAAGINLSVKKMENAPMREYLAQGQHQMCIYGFTCRNLESDGFLSQIQPGNAALARINYDNQEFFDLYTEGCATEDRDARGQIWEDCMEMLMKDYTMIPLWHKAISNAVADNVTNLQMGRNYEERYYQWVEKT